MLKRLMVLAVATEQTHWWAKSEWWLVIIAGLTGSFIGWQSWETRKSAENMSLSNKAVIESQRARIVIEINDEGAKSDDQRKWIFGLVVKNIGQTVATVFEIWERTDYFSRKDLAAPANKIAPPKKRLLGESFSVFTGEDARLGSVGGEQICPIHLAHEIKHGETYFVWYGWIAYRDFVGTIHHHRFFYAYSWAAKRFVKGGPNGYNAEGSNPN
jgi:hypothetical protein